MKQAKYSHMLDDADVRRWYENTARGSKISADVCLRRLGSFCELNKLTPRKFATLGERQLHNLLMDYVTSAEKKGYAGSYINSTMKALRSWLAHNDKELKARIKIRDVDSTPSLKDERVPTIDELRRIFYSGDKKARVSCVLIAHSGLRIQTLGDYEGHDGLRIKDLPEIRIESNSLVFVKIPTMIIVRRELSKAGHQYFTFLSEEGCEYLKDYLEERIREGENMTGASPVVTPKLKMKPFIRTVNVGDTIRGAIRQAGFQWRPYVLRSYFDTQLMLAESKGLVLRDYRQFWMGHVGDIENRYTTNKYRLPEAVIEDMRKAYGRSQEYLQTAKTRETSEEKLAQAFRKQLLLVAGFKQDEVDKLDLSAIGDEELQDIVRKRLLGTSADDCSKQKAVNIDEVNGYLTQGWEYVATLPNEKVVIKLNT